MQTKEIEQRVRTLAQPMVEEMGLRLWDVTFEKEAGTHYLCVYIDKDGGVDINECEALSRKIDPYLDGKEFDSLPPYTFCVSSAGAERRLTRPEHYDLSVGQTVEARFYQAIDGQKSVIGKLVSHTDQDVVIEENGQEKVIPKEKLAAIRWYLEI